MGMNQLSPLLWALKDDEMHSPQCPLHSCSGALNHIPTSFSAEEVKQSTFSQLQTNAQGWLIKDFVVC